MTRRLLVCLLALLLADRIRAADPPALLVDVIARGRLLPGDVRPAALGHLAWAAALADQPALARELAAQLGEDPAAPAPALAWSGAALARAGAPAEATARLRRALARVAAERAPAELEAWFGCWLLAGGGVAPPPDGRAELGSGWLGAVLRLPDPEAVVLLHRVAPALAGAGLAGPAAGAARERLGGGLRTVEGAAGVLCILGDRAAGREPLARAVRAAPGEVDERTASALAAAWLATSDEGALAALGAELDATAPWAGRLVRVADVVRGQDADALARALEDGWRHGRTEAPPGLTPTAGDLERVRLVTLLLKRLPVTASNPVLAREVLATNLRPVHEERALALAIALLRAHAEAAGQLGPRGLDHLIDVVNASKGVTTAVKRARPDELAAARDRLLEVRGACATAAGGVNDTAAKALAVVQHQVEPCLEAVERLRPRPEAPRLEERDQLQVALRALIACAGAAVRLGEPELARTTLGSALLRLEHSPPEGHAASLVLALEACAPALEPLRSALASEVVAQLDLVRGRPADEVGAVYGALAGVVAAR